MPCYRSLCTNRPSSFAPPQRPPPQTASPMTPVCYPLSFENDPFCLSRNPFLLITVSIAHVRRSLRTRSFLHSFAKGGNSSPLIATACALFAKTPGVYQNCSLSRDTPRDQSGTHPGSSCRPVPSETEDCRLMTDDCLQTSVDLSISSIPGTFRPTPAYFFTTAQSSTAPGTRLGRLR